MSAPVEGQLAFITDSVIKLELKATDKAGVLKELVGVLVEGGKIKKDQSEALLEQVLKREQLGSTGIGGGLAVPHAKATDLVDQLIGAFGRSRRGVEYGASDGEPCKLFFLIASPEDGLDEHLQILRRIATLGRHEHFIRFLNDAKTKDDVTSLLAEVCEE